MGGVGFGIRPRPAPYFALDFGVDFIGGKDFNGNRRSEAAFAVNPMVFLNSSNKVQLYIFAGLGFGGAHVDRPGGSRAYNYIGADAGAGLEFRFWRHFAFSGDVMAFIRDRSDLDGGPEYVDAATGAYTDSLPRAPCFGSAGRTIGDCRQRLGSLNQIFERFQGRRRGSSSRQVCRE
jgi:hypothetical protein